MQSPWSQGLEEELRILQVNKLYHPWIGGIETAAKDFAEHYNSRDGRAVTNLVCTPRGRRKVETVGSVSTYRAATWKIMFGMPISFDFFFLFWSLVKTADMVVLHYPFPAAFVAYWLFARKKRLAVWYHSDIVRQKLLKIPFEFFHRYAFAHADVILVSNKRIIRESPALRGYESKCKVVYFGVDLDRFDKVADADRAQRIRSEYGLPLVLSVGRLVYYKGYEYLIEAMKRVPAKLLIIGSGPLEVSLKKQIEESGLSDKVTILPSVTDLVPYYRACDVFALSSCESSEVFGIVQIEAMACSKPVVNTALPTGVPEVSVDGHSGYTVPPKSSADLGDALRIILVNADRYLLFSKNARRDVELRFCRRTMFASLDLALADSFLRILEQEVERPARQLAPAA